MTDPKPLQPVEALRELLAAMDGVAITVGGGGRTLREFTESHAAARASLEAVSIEDKEPERHNDFSEYMGKRYLRCPHCGEECGCESIAEGCGHCPSERPEPDEFEPKYVPLRKLKDSDWMQKMPVGMHDMIVDRHIRLRNEIGRIIGEIELSYYRGREAGREECSALVSELEGRQWMVDPTPDIPDSTQRRVTMSDGTGIIIRPTKETGDG